MQLPRSACIGLLLLTCAAGTGPVARAETPPTPPPAPAAVAPAAAKPATAAPVIERLPNGDIRLGVLTLHRAARQVSFAATICKPDMPLEALITTPEGRVYEGLLKTDAKPFQLQTLLLLLGLNPAPRPADGKVGRGDIVDIDLEWQKADGSKVVEPVEHWIVDVKTGQHLTRYGWVFVGTPVERGQPPQADVEGNLAITYPVGATILSIADPDAQAEKVYPMDLKRTEPATGTAVRVILTPRTKAATSPAP